MANKNLIIILLKISIEILKKEGLRGYINAIKNYYEAYPPLRKSLYYWLYSKLRSNKIIIKEIQGSKMYLNLNDFGLSKQLFLNGIREPECTRIMKKEIKKGMIILEIGANIGYYTLLEANIIGDSGTIYAFEPFQENFQLLKKNVELNNYDNIVKLYNLGISNQIKTEKLYVSNKHNRCNIFSLDGNEFVEVKTITVDKFMDDKNKKIPDMIRIDIEGFEYYVLDGMKTILKQDNPCKMFIEVHAYQMQEKGLNFKKPLNTLFESGFKPKYVKKEYGAIKEESFEYKDSVDNFYKFLEEKEILPSQYTHGFGLFLERTKK